MKNFFHESRGTGMGPAWSMAEAAREFEVPTMRLCTLMQHHNGPKPVIPRQHNMCQAKYNAAAMKKWWISLKEQK